MSPAIGEWRSAIVPLPWQAQFDDLREYERRCLVSPQL